MPSCLIDLDAEAWMETAAFEIIAYFDAPRGIDSIGHTLFLNR